MVTTEFLDAFGEVSKEEPWAPNVILCFECAAVFDAQGERHHCPECGHSLSDAQYRDLFRFSEKALRYGYQYADYYSRQFDEHQKITAKACLAELDEIYKFVALAIIGGIISGASWEGTKFAIMKIVASYDEKRTESSGPNSRKEPIFDLAELDNLRDGVLGYMDGLSHVNNEVRPLLIEEMYADSALRHLAELKDIARLRSKEKKKGKHEKRARKLHKHLMFKIIDEHFSRPNVVPADTVWGKLDNKSLNPTPESNAAPHEKAKGGAG